MHSYSRTHTHTHALEDKRTVVISNLLRLQPMHQTLHHTLVPFRLLCWQVVVLTDSFTDVNTNHTSAHVWASGHRSNVTFSCSLYTSSVIWSPNQPTLLNAGVCLRFSPTVRCLPHFVAGLLLLHPSLPLNQSGRPFDSCLSWGSAPEVAFALLKYTQKVLI